VSVVASQVSVRTELKELTPVEAAALAWRHRAAVVALGQPDSPTGTELLLAIVAPSENFHRLSIEAVSTNNRTGVT
jgi:hypothetical protein